MTSIYLVCFHSEKPRSFKGCEGQFIRVETAISDGNWPYDNGDDPSFYAATQGARLTWGVCRQDLRNSIAKDSIVVFFSFSSSSKGRILYRLCAVATVDDRVDHRAVYGDKRLSRYSQMYINSLIRPEGGGWCYDETDRPGSQQHKDWLWRIADHRGIPKEEFRRRHSIVYQTGQFSDAEAVSRQVPLADNYVIFSASPEKTFISDDPPVVATATVDHHEKWTSSVFRQLTVGKLAHLHSNGRNYLRVINSSRCNVHRQLHFRMSPGDASMWRNDLIAALKECSNV